MESAVVMFYAMLQHASSLFENLSHASYDRQSFTAMVCFACETQIFMLRVTGKISKLICKSIIKS